VKNLAEILAFLSGTSAPSHISVPRVAALW
jgi:hypothetical protein